VERLLTIALAGGEGNRLFPLTEKRSKPAVPFGGKYRIIDFTLSNCINSGIRHIYILTQYLSDSLNHHIQNGWGISISGLGDYVYCVPAQRKEGKDWYRGTADALRQNLNLIKEREYDNILILSGDHIYKMNYDQLLDYHRNKNADITLSAVRVACTEAAEKLGVIGVDKDYRVVGFQEKPKYPKGLDDASDYCLGSMGVYIFKTGALKEVLNMPGDDFGKEIIPGVVGKSNIYAYDFVKKNNIQDFVVEVKDGRRENILVERTPDSSYWKDVGSIDSYYEASIDLVSVDPAFNLYGQRWPLRTYQRIVPPSKLILGGIAQESIVSEGCIISGGMVRRSILSPAVVVERHSIVEESIIFDDVIIEPGVRIKRTIIDKNVVIKSGASLGWDLESDKRHGCTVSENGITVVSKGSVIYPL
jgi:glucose-1-phosphate adenylyltransferase